MAHQFPVLADTLFDQEPVRVLGLARVESVEDREFTPSLISAFEVDRLRHLTRLELDSVGTSVEEAYALTDCKYLAGLRELSLRGNPVPVDWMATLLAGKQFPHLEAIDLADIPNLGPAVVRGLAKAGHRRLRKIDLSGVASLSSDQLKLILDWPVLSQIEELKLGWCGGPDNPGPITHINIGWVMPWRNLRLLELTGQRIGSEGVREIAHNADAANLRWLGLASNSIGSDGADLLIESRHLRLFHLDVRGNDLDPKQVEELMARYPDAVVLF
jgi:hypothetical protein